MCKIVSLRLFHEPSINLRSLTKKGLCKAILRHELRIEKRVVFPLSTMISTASKTSDCTKEFPLVWNKFNLHKQILSSFAEKGFSSCC